MGNCCVLNGEGCRPFEHAEPKRHLAPGFSRTSQYEFLDVPRVLCGLRFRGAQLESEMNEKHLNIDIVSDVV